MHAPLVLDLRNTFDWLCIDSRKKIKHDMRN